MRRHLLLLCLGACQAPPDTDGDTDSDTGDTGSRDALPGLPDDLTVWTFAGDAPLEPLFGEARLSVWDPEDLGWADRDLRFGRASAFGAPLLDGRDVEVLSLPVLDQRRALALAHHAAPNGVFVGEGLLSRYTLILDVYVPEGTTGIGTVYQADPGNGGVGELQLSNAGIGTRFDIRGDTTFGAWHRIAWVMRAAPGEGQAHRVVDGTFVGGIGSTGTGLEIEYALHDEALLFSDGNGNSIPMVIASMGFVPEAVSYETLEALGQPTAGGVHAVGASGEDLDLAIRPTTLNFAHRGNSCCAPENTLVAIEQAFERGADHIEIDVRVTADGHVVLFHDAEVDRTSDGTGRVDQMTLAEMKQLDVGSWFSPRYAGERVATLAEAIEATDGRGRLYLDIKDASPAMASGIQAAIEEAEVGADAVWIWAGEGSIDTLYGPVVDNARYLYRGTPPDDLEVLQRLKDKGVEGFSFGSSNVDESLRPAMEKAQSLGLLVECFTILDPYRMAWLSQFGVDGMENAFPGVFDRYRE